MDGINKVNQLGLGWLKSCHLKEDQNHQVVETLLRQYCSPADA
jgi:hypothetical protein